jgi:phosphoribosyl-AMP cyclohydrolase / phosphoribosyl-ATP pyrophosphohydrolase
MIIPSIDLQGGQAVQLIGGEEKALDAGDPRPVAQRYGLIGEIAVVDLDAALGSGSNAAVIEDLLELAPCRVGGGIRDTVSATAWLDRGALKVVLGTAARPEVLRALPKERVIAALDARHGEVVVEGWQKRTGHGVLERIAELRDLVGGLLVTFVEREGRLQGTDLAFAKEIRAAAGAAEVTIAGGITTADEIAELDRLGCDAQVGMALYTGRLGLAEAFTAPVRSDRPDGLWPTIVVDERGVALGLCYSDLESLRAALEQGQGVYHSRSRGLWVKGATSGATQELLRVDADCDRDCLRFTVRQQPPGFCHLNTRTCWGEEGGLGGLARRLAERKTAAPAGSYTAKLVADPALLGAKLREEAGELAEAEGRSEVIHEAADVLYFTLATLARHDIDLADVERALDRRALKVTRRD